MCVCASRRGPCKRFQLQPSRKEGRTFRHLECLLGFIWFFFFLQTSCSYRRHLIKGQRFCPRVNHWPLPLSLPCALCVSLTPAERLNCRSLDIWNPLVAKKASIFRQNPFFAFSSKVRGVSWVPLRREKVSDFHNSTTTGSYFCRVVNSGGGGILRWSGLEPQVLVEPRSKRLHSSNPT